MHLRMRAKSTGCRCGDSTGRCYCGKGETQVVFSRERDLVLQRAMREEVEGRLEKALRQSQQAKRMATVNWWRALKMEEDRTKSQKEASLASHAREETEEKQRLAEATIQELQDQVRHLQAAHRAATPHCRNSDERRDVAVSTDPVEEAGGCVETGADWGRDMEAEKAMEAWRRVEATASQAVKAADLLHRKWGEAPPGQGESRGCRRESGAGSEQGCQYRGPAQWAEGQNLQKARGICACSLTDSIWQYLSLTFRPNL